MGEPSGDIVQEAAHQPGARKDVTLQSLSGLTAKSTHSVHGEDDNESLKWAALERLPTFDRLKTAILTRALDDGGIVHEEVDVRQLSAAERAKLVERVLETADQDNSTMLAKFRQRLDRVGLSFPTVEVRFEDLNVTAGVYVGSRALPTLSNFTRNVLESLLMKLHLVPNSKRPFPILHNVTGVLKPGRMTLLLGPPGAGKSTLLKYLSGNLDNDLKASGAVTYNGHAMDEFVPVRTAAYVSQNDNHIGEMTVRETLDFSARVQGSGYKSYMLEELQRREKDAGLKPDPAMDAFTKALSVKGNRFNVVTDYIMKILGLEICADTVVGNEMVRGISGGQKKRVTTGEMVVGPKQVLFMDEISTGLDSSTTFLITQCLSNFTRVQDATTLIALLQPAPETYDLFDDIMLLAEGHIVYHGPHDQVLPFFEAQGFRCPPRKGAADFLQEVTSLKDQGQYWHRPEVYKYVPVASFAEAFQTTQHGQAIAAELKTPFEKEKSHPEALVKEQYGLSGGALLKAVTEREFLLMKRNGVLYAAQTIQTLLVALVTMTLFFRTTLHQTIQGGNYYLGVLFFGLIMMLFNGFAEMTLLVMRLPIFYKQRDMLLFPSWAWIIPMWAMSIPFSAWASLLWGCVTYYVVGFAPAPGRFFRHLLILFLIHQMSIALFRVIGALSRNMVVANTFGSMAVIVLFCLGGFIIAKNDIHPYWIWGFWISPIAYAMNCLTTTEFLAERWQVPAGDAYPGQTIGQVILSNRGLFQDDYMYWVGIAAMVGFTVLFNLCALVALMYLKPFGKPQPVVSEDMLEEKKAARTGESAAGRVGSRDASAAASGRGALDRFRAQAALASTSRLSQVSGLSESQLSQPNSGVGQLQPPSQRVSLSQNSALSGGAPGQAPNGVGLASNSALTSAALAELGQGSMKGMVLPFEPLTLSFHHVNYFVDMPAEMKAEGASETRLQLLRDVSGAFRPGVLTALVGVSGAGKTTLMDVLAGRKTGGYIEGDIRVSGYPKVQETFARIMGYCEQNDVHSPQPTVHESLLYSAWLRLPSDVDPETRTAFVEEVMDLVELSPLRGALVGLPGVNGLSTEQRKRLTIAVELVANPSIIFMDEPTSGLDARAAAIVMRAVRNTVNTGRTVVCTIHQPSIDIFETFDELLLMKRGGQLIYMGPLGKNSQIMVDYFSAIPGVPAIHEGQNPATWMLEISSPAATDKLGVDFAEIFSKSEQARENEQLIEALKTPPEGHQDLAFPTRFSTSLWVQLVACVWKRKNMYWRAPEYNVVRYFYTLCIALLVGSVFFNLGSKRDTQQNVLNVMGALYTCALFLGWSNGASVQPIVSIERTVFYRERAAGMYHAVPYALAQGLIEIPYVFIQTVLYCVIVYAMICFEWTGAKFMWFFLFVFMTLWYFVYYGMMAIALTPNEQLSMVLSAFFFSLWNIFSGFLLPRPAMPKWWQWYYWCNPVSWSLYGLIASQLGDVNTIIDVPGETKVQTVKEFIKNYLGFEHGMLGVVVAAQFAFTIMFFLVFAYALQKLNFQKR